MSLVERQKRQHKDVNGRIAGADGDWLATLNRKSSTLFFSELLEPWAVEIEVNTVFALS